MVSRSPKLYKRCCQAAALLTLCVLITSTLLFSRLVAFSMADTRQYIPLTRSNGVTTVQANRANAEFRAFHPGGAVLLAAGPVLTADWFRAKDDNTVWQGQTQVEIFRVSYENGQGQITVRSEGEDKVIAPGTANKYTFALENTAQGDVDYTVTMKAWFSPENAPAIPVEVCVTRDTDNACLTGTAEAFADVLELNNVQDSGKLKQGYVMPYTLTWQWPFDGDDAHDTMLGNLAAEEDLALTIMIETTASYIPPDSGETTPDETTPGGTTSGGTTSGGTTSGGTSSGSTKPGGLPKTGDTSHIALWFAMMLFSAAGLMFLLLLMRRKGEDYETV